MNPAAMIKLMGAKKKFEKNHPKFSAFAKKMLECGIEEGTILEVTIIKPGGTPVRANIKVLDSDLDLLRGLKELSEDGI
ncbi:MAG: hypothetical protein K2N63_05115 [Lachnospiraceae bacterium]|nr:hypothetical protein [Lachnospiraceae bacterium]